MKELSMLKVYLKKRIKYYQHKQGENTFHQDIIEELETIENMISVAIPKFSIPAELLDALINLPEDEKGDKGMSFDEFMKRKEQQ